MTRRHPTAEQAVVRLAPVASKPAQTPSRPLPCRPLIGDADPRWLLAVRTAEQLQGEILPPERRERLVRLGRTMGLTVFDSNLVIAVVQDQARRGHRGHACAMAGEPHLGLIGSPPIPAARRGWSRGYARLGAWVAALAAAEIVLAACLL